MVWRKEVSRVFELQNGYDLDNTTVFAIGRFGCIQTLMRFPKPNYFAKQKKFQNQTILQSKKVQFTPTKV